MHKNVYPNLLLCTCWILLAKLSWITLVEVQANIFVMIWVCVNIFIYFPVNAWQAKFYHHIYIYSRRLWLLYWRNFPTQIKIWIITNENGMFASHSNGNNFIECSLCRPNAHNIHFEHSTRPTKKWHRIHSLDVYEVNLAILTGEPNLYKFM